MAHWRVEISVKGDEVLAIEPGMVAGVENPDAYKAEIMEAVNHVWAFMGFGHEPSTFDLGGE